MEELKVSYKSARNYPLNLIYPNIYHYNMIAYFQRLNGQEDRIFGNDAEAAIDFWELDTRGMGGLL